MGGMTRRARIALAGFASAALRVGAGAALHVIGAGAPRVLAATVLVTLAAVAAPAFHASRAGAHAATASPVRAAYFYYYMPVSHVDSLAASGFDRGVVHFIADTLRRSDAAQLRAMVERGSRLGVEIVPQWVLDAPARMRDLGTARRYTWGSGRIEPEIACPMDTAFWRSALLGRAYEMLAAVPGTKRIAVDLEIQHGSRHHYDAGPCRCAECLEEFRPGRSRTPGVQRHTGLAAFQRSRLTRALTRLLSEFAARHPGVELGVFDLDYDSYVHHALALALASNGIPTADYCERSYSVAGGTLTGARARLNALGLSRADLIGGLWLKRFTPRDLVPAVDSVLDRAEGYFVFTTFSLWLEPAKLKGPYVLLGTQADYWDALRTANRAGTVRP